MEKKLATARTLAGILAILLVIAIIVIASDQKTISELRAPAMQNITAQQDIIREDCTASDPSSQERCAQDLQNLSELLGKFSKQRAANAAATTSAVQGTVNNVQIEKLPKQ